MMVEVQEDGKGALETGVGVIIGSNVDLDQLGPTRTKLVRIHS